MKTIATLFLLIICSLSTEAQLQLATITKDGAQLQNIPRISWRLPFYQEISALNNKETIYAIGGIVIKNEGVIYNFDGDRFKKRVIAASPELGFSFGVGKRLILSVSGGVDYNFHYKEKTFGEELRRNKEITTNEWFSNRVNTFSYFTRFGFGFKKSFFFYAEYYFNNFLNNGFTIDGTQPYAGMQVSRLHVGFNHNILDLID